MREGWEIKKLSEVCNTGSGGTPLKAHKDYYEGGNIPWLLSGEVSQGEVFEAKNFITEKGLKNSSARLFPKNTVLIAMYGATAGQVGILRFEASTNQAVCGILPNKETVPEYLFYCFLSKKDELISQAAGNAQPNISQIKIKNTKIPFPPLPEQQRIVSILDEAFAAIDQAKANVQHNLQNAKELFQSELNSIFTNKGEGWVEKKLVEVSLQFGRGKSKHRPRNDAKLYGGKFPFIQTGDVRNSNKVITSYSQTYNEVGLKQSKLWPKGTICITIAANIAETGILNFDSCFPDSIIGLVVDPNKAEVNFAYYALQFLKTKLQLLGKGSAQDNINLGTFENQTFPFPTLKQQQDIIHRLDSTSKETKKLEKLYKHKLNELEALKKSILQKAFSGELSNKSTISKQVNLPVTISDISVTDLHAGIIALSLKRHEEANAAHTFHHVKSEKIVHLIEFHLGIDLNRTPVQDAAGPNDYPLKMRVESRAQKAGFFYVNESNGIKSYTKGSQFEKLISKVNDSLKVNLSEVYKLIDLIIPMNTQQAEIVATVYAAWNNLLLESKSITDETIVTEARENWHESKLKIQREKFFKAITWMRENSLIPKGTGKRVVKKAL